MALSLDKLWKDASDASVLDAATKWDSLNDECRQVVIAEAKRRGLALEVPSGGAALSSAAASAAAAESAPTANAKVWLIVALTVAGVAAIGYLV